MRGSALLAVAACGALACAPADDAGPDEDVASAPGTEAPAQPAGEAGAEAWEVRLDRADRGAPEDVQFEEMSPGWHVITGPAAILYDPSRTASGSYRVEAEMNLFDPGERREGYGIFIGGRDLEGDGQAYTYFLLRRDGRFLVKQRAGTETPTLTDWTEHDAINTWDERDDGAESVRNVLAIEVGEEDVVFEVNGEEVDRQPRAQVETDGIVGLRINHALNVHVSRLDVEQDGGGER